MAERHVLGISGGKDSAALAVFMRDRHPELDIDYFFTDTGEELPEVYEFLGRLEGYLGKTHRAAQPAPRLRLLAARIQPLPAHPADPLVHPPSSSSPPSSNGSSHGSPPATRSPPMWPSAPTRTTARATPPRPTTCS